MVLPTGTRLGPYEIVAPLGAGGMGEVYRARDPKLNREVAIKVLPPGVAQDAERLSRFKREAQVLASLNHPNIAAIYGLDEAGDKLFLVLELVEGEELADRLKRGAIPLDEAIELAKQIALALEEAHEKGIVHRDLKPANVKLTPDGKVKVLDFGLAKAYAADAVGHSGIDSGNSPTMTHAATMAGMILGTAAYMSPEQARGKSVNKRADIWAFGVVLYEMLSGAQLFHGETVSDTLAAVLTRELDMKALPAGTPNAVRQLLRRCLERNPKNRLHDIADARIVLDELSRGETDGLGVALAAPDAAKTPARRRVLPWAIAALAVVAAVGFALRPHGAATPSIERPQTAFGILVPTETFLPSLDSPLLDLSEDGRTLLFIAQGALTSNIYRRSMDRLAIARIEGSEGASHPLLSPDGRFIAFFAGGALRKIPAEGGAPVTLADARAPRGASWVKDGSLVYSPLYNSGLWRVPATGGAPVAVTTLDTAKGERTHRWPQALPDGRTVIFTVGLTSSPGDYDGANIDAVRLDTGERRTVLHGARMARYSSSGYLIFQRGGTLLAVRFEPEHQRTVGEPFTIAEGVGGETSSGAGHFSVSASGLLAFAPQSAIPKESVLVLIDRAGHETELPVPSASFRRPRFSPDGKRLAYSIGSGAAADDDIFLFDLADGRSQRLTFGQGHAAPVWSPDGKSLVFTQGRSGEIGLFTKRADGSGSVTPLRRTPTIILADAWLKDGRHVVVTDSSGTFDIRVLDTAEGGTITPLFASEAAAEYAAAFSPDERYAAYTTTETGTDEVFVETYPPGRGKWQVSQAGGFSPVWSHDGRELYFVSGDALMVVEVDMKGVFRAGPPRRLFSGPFALSIPTSRNYDVGPDGRFVMVKPKPASTTPREMVVLDGWEALDLSPKGGRSTVP
jgi:dipeptidyl aminopeptidase/acylaminoacyl peptidase